MNSNKNLNLWIWLSDKDSLNCVKKYKLYCDFGSIEKIYSANLSDYKKLSYLTDANIDDLCNKDAGQYDKIIDLYSDNSVKLVSIDMPEYPNLLKQISNPPVLLYMRGRFIDLNKHLTIAMVGTRKATKYGEVVAYNLARDLAEAGAVVVSGMALGIDTKAHKGALSANMPTVAVIGTGVNVAYPVSNSSLMKEIIKTGMVISEYPLNAKPEKYHFPERNRIISGLSYGCAVVEADIKSGSLITAKFAYEQNRDVFAVPGNINSTFSKGTNHLIKDGAYPITCADDILYSYKNDYSHLLLNNKSIEKNKKEILKKDYTKTNEKPKSPVKISTDVNLNPLEEIILKSLTYKPMHIDELCEKSKVSIKDANSILLYLELNKKIVSHPGNCYSLNSQINQED